MRILYCLLLLLFIVPATRAQGDDSPVAHMEFFASRETVLSKKYLDYMSQVAHGNRARKMEKRRQELISEIRRSLGEANRVRPYKGDPSLRDAFRSYWDVLLKVFTEDYHKIVDMEAIAQESYDQMEAYLMAQEKASEVLGAAHARIEPAYAAFAEKNNVRLIDQDESKLQQKLRQVAAVNAYYHRVFLIFFKSFKQEAYVMDALARKDINSLEQNRSTLVKYAEEGLQRLDTLEAFRGDGSLLNACKQVLTFQKMEAENHLPELSAFLLKTDEFEKIKKAFESKPAGKRTKDDVNLYNDAVNDVNAALENSNNVIAALNSGRDKVMQRWESSRQHFLERHVPR